MTITVIKGVFGSCQSRKVHSEVIFGTQNLDSQLRNQAHDSGGFKLESKEPQNARKEAGQKADILD